MNKTAVLRLTVLAAFVIVDAVLVGLALKWGPQWQARITTTPTRTARATFTATSLPTHTPVPLPMARPTDTPRPTLTPTDTPAPTLTATPSPAPTKTPRPPTATATRKPPATPTRTPRPRPTHTPAPPFVGQIVKGMTRCDGYAGVAGYVRHADKSPFAGASVGVWSDPWDGQVVQTEETGKFDQALNALPRGDYYVAVVQAGSCGQGARTCTRLSNVLVVTTTEACTGPGANQVTEVLFVGP